MMTPNANRLPTRTHQLRAWSDWLTRRKTRWVSLVAIVLALLSLGLTSSGMSSAVDLFTYDLLVARKKLYPPPPLTLIEVTEQDIAYLKTWPIPDNTLAHALANILDVAPRVVGVDIYRDFPIGGGEQTGPSLTDLLSDDDHKLVFPMYFDMQMNHIHAPPGLHSTEQQVGFANLLIDADSKVRRGMLYVDNGTESYRSFALQIALSYLSKDNIAEADASGVLQLGPTEIPPLPHLQSPYVGAEPGGYQFLIDYASNLKDIPRYSFRDALENRIARADINDRIVMIGVTAVSAKDYFVVPNAAQRTATDAYDDQLMAGLHIHAQVLGQLLRYAKGVSVPTQIVPPSLEILWIVLWSFSGAWLGAYTQGLRNLTASCVGAILVITTAHGILFHYGLWLPEGTTPVIALGAAALTSVIARTLRARTRESRVRQMFASQVGEEIAQWIEHHSNMVDGRLPSTDLTATIFFSDLVGFSRVAERMSAHFVLAWLNDYMAAMHEVIAGHGGVVIQFHGDAVFAAFGVPIPRTSHTAIAEDAQQAVRAAMACGTRLQELNRSWIEQGWFTKEHPVGMRVGLSTGVVVAGGVGINQFWRYTLYGNTVNIAARLESLQKDDFKPSLENPCRVFMTESTKAYASNLALTKFYGDCALRSKTETVRVYALESASMHSVTDQPLASTK